MAFQPGTTNRTALRYVKEVVFGTTPATPVLSALRYLGESINFNQTSITSQEIRPDRTTPDLVRVDAEVAGDMNFEWSFESFDAFIAAALCSTFSAPVAGVSTIENGIELHSFTLQKHFQDLAVPLYQNFTGCRIGGFTMDFQTGAILTGAFNIMGLVATQGSSQIAGATFDAPGEGREVMNAVSNLVNIEKDGVALATKVRTMTLALTNNLRAQKAVGTLGSVGVGIGRLEITGNIEMYFENADEYNAFLNDTPFALSFTLEDPNGTDSYKFELPRCKYETGTVVAGALDQDVMVSGTWRAIFDATEACMIRITRTEAP